ncbi:Cytochrome CYP324A1 [Operophtera brumata]|uniref:unspecific monooxygenase n=1 Tax=Operophtera brumata TaxID=104452 RepID=A0A0L7LSI1_OPEBR|nr:Cytochrome CYP324A1 [Operophtera brumata]
MLLVLAGIVVASLLLWWQLQWRRLRNYWAERGVPHEPPHPILGSLTFLQRENPRLTAVFTAAKLRSLEGLVRGKAADLVQRIGDEMKRDPDLLDLRNICTDYSTDVIGEAAFGIKSESALTGDSVIRKITKDFMQFSVFRGLAWSSIFFFPALVDIFRKLFKLMVEQRGGLDRPVAENRDLLDALINMRQDAAKENEEMSEELLLAQAAIFLQGGFDTSGGALTWMIYELAHQPQLQERLYEELKAATDQVGTEKLDSTQLAELPYMNAVIKETLRKWTPMGWLDRIASRDYKLDERLTVRSGTVLYVNAYGLQWDPDHFPEPERFQPDRFLPENERSIKPYTYMPFGEGPRICIGNYENCTATPLARSNLHAYSVRPVPGAPTPNQASIEKKGMLLMPDQKITAHWLRRLYSEFKSPYVGIWVFWRPGLVVNSPELAKRVLVKDADNFRNRYLASGKSDPIGSLNLFTSDDPLWSSVRRRLTAVFTASKLRSLQGLTRLKADDLTERINHEMTKEHDLFNLRVNYTTDVIGESAFGVKSEATKTGDSVIRKVTKDFMKFGVFRGLSWSSIFFFPKLMSEDLLLAQAAIFLQGGFDTSGAALTWTIYELAHQPHLQDRLYQELLDAKDKYGTVNLDSTQLAELTYLNAVVKETLRKFMPMGWLDRIAAKDYKVDDKLTIPAGTVVYVNALGMHWDPDYFPEPEIYDPDRKR